jgi:hypothetical protein
MAAQWPLVVARLVTLLPTLSGWSAVTVFDGPPVTADVTSDYVTVGFVADDQAGDYNQTQDPNGFQYVETGTVRSQLSCITGDIDFPSMRTRVFALMDALEAAVRADRRLGVLSPSGTSELDVDVLSLSNANGTAQSLVFTLHYQTVT